MFYRLLFEGGNLQNSIWQFYISMTVNKLIELNYFLYIYYTSILQQYTMSNLIKNKRKTNKAQQAQELHSLIRKQVVQPYPYSSVKPASFYEEDPIQQFLKQTPIIEGYHNKYDQNRKNRFYFQQQPEINAQLEKKRGYTDYRKIQYNMEVEEGADFHNYNDYTSNILRKSNESSLQKIPFRYDPSNDHIEEQYMEIQQIGIQNRRVYQQEDLLMKLQKRSMSPLNNIIQHNAFRQDHEKYQSKKYHQQFFQPNAVHQLRSMIHPTYVNAQLPSSANLQRQQKIKKLQQVGCNCRKSKCLKMYCECFHLQIFCNENCNCVGCGNMEQTHDHQQAIIEALTRNPKAFEHENPQNEGRFGLGVGLGQVKKGCKCKKTKCLKKYCQCYSTNNKCGKFCKCQGCQNSL